MPGQPFLSPSAEDELRSALRFLDTALNSSRHAARRHHVAKAIERLASAHYLLGRLEALDQDTAPDRSAARALPA